MSVLCPLAGHRSSVKEVPTKYVINSRTDK
jgi:hypothetical protein